MSQTRIPWLFLKRLDRWSPLAAVRPMLTPTAAEERPDAAAEPSPGEGM